MTFPYQLKAAKLDYLGPQQVEVIDSKAEDAPVRHVRDGLKPTAFEESLIQAGQPHVDNGGSFFAPPRGAIDSQQ